MEEKPVKGWQLRVTLGAAFVTFACPFCAQMQFDVEMKNLTERFHKCPTCGSLMGIQFNAYKGD
jgi:hypothetical protein